MGRASRRHRRAKVPALPAPLGPHTAAPSARDVPRIRAQMAAWAADATRYGARAWLRALMNAARIAVPGFADAYDPQPEEEAVARWARTLPAAQLFYVASNLSTLVHHAAASLTDYRLHPDDLPAHTGFMIFAEPLRDTDTTDPAGRPVTLVTWSPAAHGILLEFWIPTRYAADEDPQTTIGYAVPGTARALYRRRHTIPKHLLPAQILPTHGYLYQRPATLPFGERVDTDHDADEIRATHLHDDPDTCATCHDEQSFSAAHLQRLVVAAWLLMGQSITTETRLRPQPAAVGAAPHAPAPLSEVRYVELRAAKRPANPQHDGPGSGRVYRHSWIVRGHWRRQWYPSRGEHRPIWINPHLAGPEDAPLVGGERVNVLRR